MYAGPKEHLRAIYDEILTFAKTLGRDIGVSPCQTIVPIYRNHVIAQIKPTTRTRIDLGLALQDTKTPKRLIDTGGFAKKDRITHRIEISSICDFRRRSKALDEGRLRHGRVMAGWTTRRAGAERAWRGCKAFRTPRCPSCAPGPMR